MIMGTNNVMIMGTNHHFSDKSAIAKTPPVSVLPKLVTITTEGPITPTTAHILSHTYLEHSVPFAGEQRVDQLK